VGSRDGRAPSPRCQLLANIYFFACHWTSVSSCGLARCVEGVLHMGTGPHVKMPLVAGNAAAMPDVRLARRATDLHRRRRRLAISTTTPARYLGFIAPCDRRQGRHRLHREGRARAARESGRRSGPCRRRASPSGLVPVSASEIFRRFRRGLGPGLPRSGLRPSQLPMCIRAALETTFIQPHVKGFRPNELDHMHWGVEMARKGGVPVDRVLNAMALPTLLRSLSQRRRSVGRAA
jgi:hypothetical protein